MDPLPKYIEGRIRRPIPPESAVIPGSTPVVSFGNAQRATIATLGLNPSRVEFLDHDRNELTGDARRLATHTSLGTSDLSNASVEIVAKVLGDSNSYFQRNPYRRWFDQLMPILSACRGSYYDSTACHLDLVQWATDPTWAKLQPAAVRAQLLEADAAFLAEQLPSENLRLLLVNGMAAVRQLAEAIGHDLPEVDSIVGCSRRRARLFAGSAFGLRIVGWSTNVQSSFGVTRELRRELAERVSKLAA